MYLLVIMTKVIVTYMLYCLNYTRYKHITYFERILYDVNTSGDWKKTIEYERKYWLNWITKSISKHHSGIHSLNTKLAILCTDNITQPIAEPRNKYIWWHSTSFKKTYNALYSYNNLHSLFLQLVKNGTSPDWAMKLSIHTSMWFFIRHKVRGSATFCTSKLWGAPKEGQLYPDYVSYS